MLLDIILRTPYWVFGLLVGLCLLGWQQTRRRQIKQRVAFLLPLGMIVLSLSGIISSFSFNPLFIVVWIVGLGLSVTISPYLIPKVNAKYNEDSQLFVIEGSWVPMIVILCIFMAKYITGVISAVNPQLLDNVTFVYVVCGVYGMLSGIFVSRSKQLIAVK